MEIVIIILLIIIVILMLKDYMTMCDNEIKTFIADELCKKIHKAIEVYENRNTTKIKKKRFMEDKSTATLMYEILTNSEVEDNELKESN